MKNQNDLIFSIVAFVVLLIVGTVAFVERPVPVMPADPEQVNVSDPKIPTNTQPVMANALPGGGSSGGGGGLGSAGAGGGGAPQSDEERIAQKRKVMNSMSKGGF